MAKKQLIDVSNVKSESNEVLVKLSDILRDALDKQLNKEGQQLLSDYMEVDRELTLREEL